MRIISILITLLIIAFLISKQLGTSSPYADAYEQIEGAPKVPTSPEELKEFKGEMETFLQNTVEQNDKKLEEALSQ